MSIEIHGHVHGTGKNTNRGQKLSEERAKRVMAYFVKNGIEEERITFIGFRNTKPVFSEAKNSKEEQQNRRVEIVMR
jgi:outer membrane protein OmpA-like peptidoglycan-associated protein